MRLDKYLKVSRIIKRRTVANDACSESHVTVNGKKVKPAYDVKIGDVIEVQFGERIFRCRVKDTPEHVGKNEASLLYEVLGEE
ncbi:MAG: RNA-binding S4 domain-containing protein [Clostridia bacterium]|nr:RNA-binding S4 domain-containing protein [Clostridia bacterium]